MPGQPWLHDLVTVLSAPTAVLSEPGGQIRPDGAQGVLHADRRLLSKAVLEMAGAEPVPVSSGLLAAGTALFTSVPRNLGDGSPDPAVRLEREREVTAGRVRERLRLISAGAPPGHGPGGYRGISVVLRVAADLAGIADIKSGAAGEPARPGITRAAGAAQVAWESGPVRAVLSAPGATASAGGPGEVLLRWQVHLPGRGEQEFGWELAMTDRAAVIAAVPPGGWWGGVRAEAADPRLPRLLGQSLADAAALRMSAARAPGDVFLAAGSPWYFTLFGRDSIWAARLLLPFGWQLAAGTLRALAAFQGQEPNPATGEAPGKIPHEVRADGQPPAPGAARLPPLYYGSIDATPLWVCLLHDAWRWGMPAAEVRELLPCLTAALEWMRSHGDADGDSLLEYIDESGQGLSNQGWKDSVDSVRFADGSIALPPVALCEVQGYAYEAASLGADLLDAFGAPGAGQWRAWAGQVAAAFRRSFWVDGPAGRYPALAVDSEKQPVDSLTSNIGHLLGTGLLTPEEEGLVAARIAGQGMDSGFGLRTMAAGSGGYSPLSYHCGSVWSHDTAIVIRGLARSGHAAAAASLADGLLAAASWFGWRLPEVFSGEARSRVPWPVPYPASCRPQAWAAAAAGALVQSLLGLEADVPAGTVRLAPIRPGRARPARAGRSARPAGAGRSAPQAGGWLHVEGLAAGGETFSAGIDARGDGYLRGLSLTPENG